MTKKNLLNLQKKKLVKRKRNKVKEEMGTQNTQTDNQPTATLPTTSCKKHVNDDNATFLANLKDRFTELVNTPMDEHKTCFKNTMDKVLSQFSISPKDDAPKKLTR
ncbi:hypothetical protein HID58_010431 [Brassica napus]|uniref:Uncharacterized protein n=2 Tax=Brassica TaxID=3705 RepID=A0ABQ8DVJ8_BRANA|nr:hypothetical protein HID58_010431 [Brassica napus]VDC80729.1 unnamed protein product [Brassica rapa]